jgi:hypothetical protein
MNRGILYQLPAVAMIQQKHELITLVKALFIEHLT